MAEKRLKVSIVGKSPLLTNNPASMKPTKTGTRGEKIIPTPDEEASTKIYQDEHGRMCFPGIGPRNALIAAAGTFKVKTRGSSRAISSRPFFSTLRVEPELIPILDAKSGKVAKSYAVDTRRAVVQKQGVQRSRPRFEGWRLDFELVGDEYELAIVEPILQPVLEYAGRVVGIGDYRPQKTGWFGTFELRA